MQCVAIADIHEISRGWKYIIDNTSSEKQKYKVVAYATGRADYPDILDDVPVISYAQFSSLYKNGAISKLILPRERFYDQSTLISDLSIGGVKREDVLLTGRRNDKTGIDKLVEYDDAPYLPYMEFHIVDQCNLNCKGCEHYSGLVRNPYFHEPERLYRDLRQLKKYITDIGKIRILGGEPLLHPDIEKIMIFAREVYPDSDIQIVTNGLLINRMPATFFNICKKNGISLYISYYPPMIDKIDEVKDILEAKGAIYHITALMTSFRIKYTLNRQKNIDMIFNNCTQSHCCNLYEGKVAACFLPFTTKYFNRYFNQNLPEDGWVNLYDKDLTTHKLKKFLSTPFERCHYCMPKHRNITWDKISCPSNLSDWLYEYDE